ncbi:MAG: argininosuccinate lyase, partial [Pseudomonadota bacterium]
AAMTGMIADLTVNETAMRDAANRGHATATDLADWLVRALDMPFRDAHHATGAAVARADALGLRLDELPLSELQAIDNRITNDVVSVLSVEASVASRTSFGGAAPQNVKSQIDRWRKALS